MCEEELVRNVDKDKVEGSAGAGSFQGDEGAEGGGAVGAEGVGVYHHWLGLLFWCGGIGWCGGGVEVWVCGLFSFIFLEGELASMPGDDAGVFEGDVEEVYWLGEREDGVREAGKDSAV